MQGDARRRRQGAQRVRNVLTGQFAQSLTREAEIDAGLAALAEKHAGQRP